MTQPTAEEIRDEADRILSKPEFQEPTPSLIDRAWDRVWDAFTDLLSRIVGPVGNGGYYFGWFILIAAALVIAYLLYRVMPRFSRVRAQPKPEVIHESEERISRREWLERARAAEGDGQFGAAIHAQYRALRAGLVDKKELPPEPGHTSGEALVDFSGSGNRSAALGQAVGTFEEVWFGGGSAGASDVDRFRNYDDAVLSSGSSDEERA